MLFFLTETKDNMRRQDEFGGMHVEVVCRLQSFTSHHSSSQKICEPLLNSFCYSIFGLTDDYVKPRKQSTSKLELA